MTDRYAVIGRPVAQSRSPAIHEHFAMQLGHQLSYERIDCAAERFDHTVRAFFAAGGAGLNVTAPYKQAAFELVERTGVRARIASAVNVIAANAAGELSGDNTDGTGLVRDLVDNIGITLRDSRILVLGAGGAARGIAAPLLGQRPASLTIANRTFERAVALVENLAGFGTVAARRLDAIGAADFDLVVNATAAGLGQAAPQPACDVSGSVCYDLAYGNEPTPFMRWAQQHGAREVYDGWGMLVEQAAESFYIWRGVWPRTEALLSQGRAKL